MSAWLWVWLQVWGVPTAAQELVQDPRVVSGHAQDAWIGYRASRSGQTQLFLHRVDTSGSEPFGRNGLCVSCSDTAAVLGWDMVIGEQGWAFLGWRSPTRSYLAAVATDGRIPWRLALPGATQHLALLPHPQGGAVCLIVDNEGVQLTAWEANGSRRFAHTLASADKPLRKARLLPSNLEGFLALWERFDGQKWQLWIQKWRWSGEAEGPAFVLSGLEASVEAASFLGDGYGGLLAVYESVSLSGAGKDLRLVRYNRSGNRLYDLPLCTEPGDQQNPRLYKRGTDLLVVWEDNRKQDWDLYFQRIDISTGKPLLRPEGVPLIELPGPQRSPHLVLDYFQNELVALWVDLRRLQADIYLQRFSAEAKPLWEFTGRPLAVQLHQEHSLAVATQDFQYFWVAYLEDLPQEGTYPHLVLCNTQGQIRFRRRLVGNTERPQARFSALRALPWGESLLLCWRDDRDDAKRPQLYVQLLDTLGVSQWPAQGLPLSPQPHLTQEAPQLLLRRDTLWALWEGEESEVESDLFAQGLTREGKKLFLPKPFLVCGADRVQHEPRWVPHPTALYASWTDSRSLEETGFDVYVRRVWPSAPEAGWRAQPSLQNSAFLFFTPEGRAAHHLWQEEVAGKYQILYTFGPLGEVTSPLFLSPTAKPQRFLQAIAAPEGQVYAAFCEESPGPYEQALRIFGFSQEGGVRWQARSPLPYKHHLYPQLHLLPDEDVLITALAQSGQGRWDLIFMRYDSTGALKDKGVLLSPVAERSRWQLQASAKGYWLLLQLPNGYTLYQGARLEALKPVRLPGPADEAFLVSWRNQMWLFWASTNRDKLHLSPLSPLP